MRLRIKHTTRYRFAEPVAYGLQQLRKTPKSGHQQEVLDWTTTVENGRKEVSFEDHHHNVVELISIDRDATEVTVVSEGEVTVEDSGGVVGRHPGPSPLWLYERETKITKCGSGGRAIVRKIDASGDLDRLHALMRQIGEQVTYATGESQSDWTAEEAIAHGKGVCQDHAHIFLACAREMGFPARYVSGYLMMDEVPEQEAGHAWAELMIDGLGWVGFDVSNAVCPDDRYVRVAVGRDYADAAPVHGLRQGDASEELCVSLQVQQ